MKAIVLLAVIFFKASVFGAPVWISLAILALVALLLAYWYRSQQKRSETQSADQPANVAGEKDNDSL